MKPFFSLVIPCYNDGRYAPGYYIDRLLTNIVEQGIDKEDLEVIISDDHSPIPYQGTLDRYKDKLNIKFVETDYNFAPGNTRQKGADNATGRWLCFADHDDVFYPDALKIVKAAIEQNDEKYIVYSDFDKVSSDNLDVVVETFRDPKLGTWVHGKFYNLSNFWRPYHLHFIKDLKTHEDLALGRQVECALHRIGRTPLYIKKPLYKWVWIRDSVSHGTYVASKDDSNRSHPFLESHFNDFLISQIDSILGCYKDELLEKNEALSLTLTGMSNAFLTVNSFKYANPDSYDKSIETYSSRALHAIEDELEVDLAYIKVVLKTAFKDLLDRIDTIANKAQQSNFLDWLTEIQTIDYKERVERDAEELANDIELQKKAEKPAEPAPKKSRGRKSNKNHRPFFSVIIPCYNDGRYKEGVYLDRLLSSLTRQDMPKEDLEVICADDCSPVPFDEIRDKYKDQLNIKYIKTDYNFAPGNTRAKGVTIATGEWLCFADHDDIYYDGGLKAIYDAIVEKNEQHFAFGDFHGVSPEGKVLRKYECHLNWCHGKFYNRDNFWDKYNIHFIKDLKSHEDIAICTQTSCALAQGIPNYTYVHKPIYAWTDNPQSVSHAKYTVDTESGPREFLEVFFEDYLHATGYIYIEKFKEHTIKIANAVKGCLEIMCYAYFYTQGFQFRRPDDFYKKNLHIAGEFIDICKKTFNMTNASMYRAIASEGATMYYKVRKLADPGSGRYIPTQTLKQWFELVSPDKEESQN